MRLAALMLAAVALCAAAPKSTCPKGTDARVECAEVKRGLFVGRWHVLGFFSRRELSGTGDKAQGADPIEVYPEVKLIEELARREAERERRKPVQGNGTLPSQEKP